MKTLVQLLLATLVRLGFVSSEALIHIAARVHFRAATGHPLRDLATL